MKILIITNDLLGTNGRSSYTLFFVKYFIKHNVNFIVACNKINKKLPIKQYSILDNPEKYYSIHFPLSSIRKLNHLIKKEKIDIIHITVEPYAMLIPFILNTKIKSILSIHGTYAILPIKTIARPFILYYYKKVNSIIHGSNFTKKYFKKEFPLLFDKLKYKFKKIKYGIFLENKIKVPLDTVSVKRKKTLLHVGGIKKRKGVLEAINGVNTYCKTYQNYNIVFNIVGKFEKNDIYYKKVINLIKKYKLTNIIKICGYVSEDKLINYYKNSDIFLMPSIIEKDHFEGFGLVYIEANSYGVATIGSNNSGTKEAIKNGYSGYIINPSNPIEISTAIHNIIDLQKIKKENIIKRANQNNINKSAKLLLKHYKKILGKQ